MAKKCKSCGAPLDFSGEIAEVKCMYCDTINTNNSINLGKIVSEFFKHASQGEKKKSNTKMATLILLFSIIIPVPILLYNFNNLFWRINWYSDCQFIDYNDDQALDIIGFGRKHANTQILTIVDGETGELLVDNDIQDLGVLKKLYCLDNKHILTTSLDEVCYYNKDDLSVKYSFEYSGSIQGFQIVDEVLCLKFYDSGENQYWGVNVNNGEEVSCKKKKIKLPKTANYDNFHTDQVTKIKYEVKYSNKSKTTLSAIKGAKTLWEKKLRGLKIESRNAFQDTPNTIVVFGNMKKEKNSIFLFGIDKETGQERYVKEKKADFVMLNDVYYNNKYVVCYWSDGLEAYNPDTGDLVWSL